MVAAILKQDKNKPVPIVEQVILLYALANGFMDRLLPELVSAYQAGVMAKIKRDNPDLIAALIEKKDLTEEIKEGLHEQLTAYGAIAL